jgi:hypothetical protein
VCEHLAGKKLSPGNVAELSASLSKNTSITKIDLEGLLTYLSYFPAFSPPIEFLSLFFLILHAQKMTFVGKDVPSLFMESRAYMLSMFFFSTVNDRIISHQ